MGHTPILCKNEKALKIKKAFGNRGSSCQAPTPTIILMHTVMHTVMFRVMLIAMEAHETSTKPLLSVFS